MEKCTISKIRACAVMIAAGVIIHCALTADCMKKRKVSDRFGDKEYIDHWVYPEPYRELRDGSVHYFS